MLVNNNTHISILPWIVISEAVRASQMSKITQTDHCTAGGAEVCRIVEKSSLFIIIYQHHVKSEHFNLWLLIVKIGTYMFAYIVHC